MSAARVCLWFASLLNLAAADEPPAPLPAEGAWVRHHIVHKPEDGTEVTYKATIKFLGRKDHNGVACRWVEMVEVYDDGNTSAIQYLIPERALQNSAHPLKETVLAHLKEGDGDIRRVERLELDLVLSGVNESNLLFLPALRTKAQPLDERQIVEHPRGRFVIPRGVKGEFRFDHRAVTVPETRSLIYNYQLWLEPKAAAGFARAHFKGSFERNGTATRKWTVDLFLEDFGNDAKSIFPE